jgi:Glycogen recognition site of AMP-activated protein kinase
MNPDLRAYLDGELRYEDLSPESRAEAAAWDELVHEMKQGEPAGAPPWLEGAVMTEVAAKPAPAREETALQWLLRSRTIHMSPLTGTLAAAAILVLFLLPRQQQSVTTDPAETTTAILVEFRLEAPGAMSVALAGDFNDWETDMVLEDRNGDGVWRGRVPIQPGIHKYMFVIDGTEWVTDPDAERYSDDGFGNRNAVLAVTPVT